MISARVGTIVRMRRLDGLSTRYLDCQPVMLYIKPMVLEDGWISDSIRINALGFN